MTDARRRREPVATDALLTRIAARDFTVGIMGLGYVGLPLALVAVKSGFRVLGFDINSERVATLNRGQSAIAHIATDAIRNALASGKFAATSDLVRLLDAGEFLRGQRIGCHALFQLLQVFVIGSLERFEAAHQGIKVPDRVAGIDRTALIDAEGFVFEAVWDAVGRTLRSIIGRRRLKVCSEAGHL